MSGDFGLNCLGEGDTRGRPRMRQLRKQDRRLSGHSAKRAPIAVREDAQAPYAIPFIRVVRLPCRLARRLVQCGQGLRVSMDREEAGGAKHREGAVLRLQLFTSLALI